MKFWNFSSQALAAVLASLSVVAASGPADGDAIADPNSAVVKLTAKNFKEFLDNNPLVLTEFFAPWCGYCKQLGPEFASAADSLNESHPKIKLAQVDCTEEETLCQQHQIRGYPTLKVMRGAYQDPEDYEGPRDAEGIAEYMVKLSLPPVVKVANVADFVEEARSEKKPYFVQIFPEAAHQSAAASNETYGDLAFVERKHMSFFSIENDESIKEFNELINVDISGDEPKYLVIHPTQLDDVRLYDGKEVTQEALKEWASDAKVPGFGDINRDTYLVYMSSTKPLGYFFYNTGEERAAVHEFFEKKAKELRGKINFVGLDATQFGRHAEVLNMDPSIVPLFAIQDNTNGRKYGIDQTENPVLTVDTIEKFIDDFLDGKIEPIIKSEPLPTEEEIASTPVTKLVSHNYNEILGDLKKDIFVKYYAPWCGHCKKLAPDWEKMAKNFEGSDVVIAHIDHTLNDVDTPFVIEGYPTLIFYPANGEVDPKTGLREHITYDKARDLETLIEFIKEKGTTESSKKEFSIEESDAEEADEAEEAEEAAEEAIPVADDVEEHDEL